MEYNLVLIEWKDICDPHAGWKSLEESAEFNPMPCKSVGWLIFENPEKVIIAQDISGDEETNGLSVFPRGCIKDIKRIKYE